MICIFVTSDYFLSPNCQREVVTAVQKNKPIILLLEGDLDHGGATALQLRGEIERLEQRGVSPEVCRTAGMLVWMLEQALDRDTGGGTLGKHSKSKRAMELAPPTIEWHREKVLKEAALKAIVFHVMQAHPKLAVVAGETHRSPAAHEVQVANAPG